ncbi:MULTISPECIES: hypothetical protein [unclassified Luteimonas]
MGSGSGRKVATVAGAVAGGAIGRNVDSLNPGTAGCRGGSRTGTWRQDASPT